MLATGSGAAAWLMAPQEEDDDDCRTTAPQRPAPCFGNCSACETKLCASRRPLLLPCLHSVCQGCVPRAVGLDFADCPLCGLEYSLQDVTDDPFLNESQFGSGAQAITTCGGCEVMEVHGWCVDCGEALCSICVSAHQRVRVTREHTILPQKNSAASAPAVYCKVHAQEPAKLFCLSCDHPVCRDCFLKFHKTHGFQFLHDAVIDEKEKIRSLMEKVKLQRNQVRKSLSDLDRRLLDLTELQSKVKGQLRDTILCIRAALLNRAMKLALEMKELCGSERGGVLERRSVLRKLEERQSFLLSFTERALDTESHAALLACRGKIQSQLRDVLSRTTFPGTSMMKLTFRCDQDTYSRITTFGRIVAKSVPFACSDHQSTTDMPHVCSGVSSTETPPCASPCETSTSSQRPPTSCRDTPTQSSSQVKMTSSHGLPTSSHETSCLISSTSLNISSSSPLYSPAYSQHPPSFSRCPPTSSHDTISSSSLKMSSSSFNPPTSLLLTTPSDNRNDDSQEPLVVSHTRVGPSHSTPRVHQPPPRSPPIILRNNLKYSKLPTHPQPSQSKTIITPFEVPRSSHPPPPFYPKTAGPPSSLISPLPLVSPVILYYPVLDVPNSSMLVQVPNGMVLAVQTTPNRPFGQATPTAALPYAAGSSWSSAVMDTATGLTESKEDQAPCRPGLAPIVKALEGSPYERAPPAGHEREGHTDRPAATENEPTSTEISKVKSADREFPSIPATAVPSRIPTSASESALFTLKGLIDRISQIRQSPTSAKVEASRGQTKLRPRLPISSPGSVELQPQPPIGSPGSVELQPQLPISSPSSAELQPQSPAQVELEDESDLYGCPVNEDNIDETDITDTESAQEPRKADGRLLIPRVSLFRIPVSFPPPGHPLPQFRFRPRASKQGVHLEQITEDGQGTTRSRHLGTIHLKLAGRGQPILWNLRRSQRSKAKSIVEKSPVASSAQSRVTDGRANRQPAFRDSAPKSGTLNAPPPSPKTVATSKKKRKRKKMTKKKEERCAICHSGGELVACTDCGRSFHADCHVPPNATTDGDQWQCMLCEDMSDVWSPHAGGAERDPSLSLADQRKCEHLFLNLISKKHSAVLYQQSELLPHSSHYIDITLIRGRLLQKLSPAYRTPSEFVSDIWLLLNTLSMSSTVAHPVAKLQRTFQKSLRQVSWTDINPSPPESAQKTGEEGGVVESAEPEAAKEARKTKKRMSNSLKKSMAEPAAKKPHMDMEGDGEKE